MGRTPDRTPGPSLEEELQLEDNGVDPSIVDAITQNAGVLKAKNSIGVFDLRSGSGFSEAAPKTLRHLIHFIDDGPAVVEEGGSVETQPKPKPKKKRRISRKRKPSGSNTG